MTKYDMHFTAMGSSCHFIVLGDPTLLTIAHDEIERLEALWSRFRPTSEISMLNANRGNAVKVSQETFNLVSKSLEGYRLTHGRVDPTVLGDLLRAGYSDTIEAVIARPRTETSVLVRGASRIETALHAQTIKLPHNVGFDPGGIGKGLAADLVAELLMDRGADGVCVNLGGDLRVAGVGPDGDRWLIEIAGDPSETIAIGAGGVATSCTYKRAWVTSDGPRHHLIDPATGSSAETDVQATAVAGKAWYAEIAAKSALLAPPGEQLDAFDELCCAGRLTSPTTGDRRTDNWSHYATLAAA